MRKLADVEVVELLKLVNLEFDGLSVARTMIQVIIDDDLRKHYESIILQSEGRIKALLQFISENDVLEDEEEGEYSGQISRESR